MAREKHLPALFQLFRQHGYDGVSLSKIAATTELGKASLYHHFPGGKAEMVAAALAYYGVWMEEHVFSALRSEGSAIARLKKMCDRLSELYNSGQAPCLIAAIVTGSKQDVFQEQVKTHLQRWIEAIAQVLKESNLDTKVAYRRAEDAIIAIQGALILSRGTGETAIFERALLHIPFALCADLDNSSVTSTVL